MGKEMGLSSIKPNHQLVATIPGFVVAGFFLDMTRRDLAYPSQAHQLILLLGVVSVVMLTATTWVCLRPWSRIAGAALAAAQAGALIMLAYGIWSTLGTSYWLVFILPLTGLLLLSLTGLVAALGIALSSPEAGRMGRRKKKAN